MSDMNPTLNEENMATGREAEGEVRGVLTKLVAARNRGDAKAYGEIFDEDADYVTIMGTHSKGRDAIAQLHEFLFKGPFKGSRLEGYGSESIIRFPNPDTAVVVSHGSATLANDTSGQDRSSINTTVLVRRGGKWLITAFQNNRVQRMESPRQ